jgi:hypothetical protein
MSYPFLKRMGVTGFPNEYIVLTKRGTLMSLPLAGERYFTTAFAWADGLLATDPEFRLVTLQEFNAVISRGAAMNAANKLLESGGPASLQGATCGPIYLSGITADEILESRCGRRSRNNQWWKIWRS